MATEVAAEAQVRVAILGTTLLGRADIKRGLQACGLRVEVEETLTNFLSDFEHQGKINVILVDLEQADDDDLDILDALLEHSPVPMVFHDVSGRADNAAWIKRLGEKLSNAARGVAPAVAAAPASTSAKATPNAAPTAPAAPTAIKRAPAAALPKGLRCWVLGASFGGPEALKRFLTSVPEVPANATFIIGQHIGDGFVEVLAAQLNRATQFTVEPAKEGALLESGRIYVAPVRERLRIDESGYIRLSTESERHTYMPSIDSIMEEAAAHFGINSGAIIFSGMGDDGTRGCTAVASAGGVIWAQDRASCAIDSMPNCARATGLDRHNGAPEQLAVDMVAYLKEHAAQPAG